MKEKLKKIINIPNIFFILILLTIRLPSKYGAEMRGGLKSVHAFLFVVILIEAAFLFAQFSKKDSIQSAKKISSSDITGFVFIVLWFWEFFVSRLNVFPYIFVPAPENVFHVFIDDYKSILLGFVSSMYLLLVGMLSALICAVVLGTIVGWNNRLCNAIYPIAKAISTVPPLIYTPYVVLILPTFKMASLFVIFLSIFWGTFMGAINNTRFVEKKIINSAIVLNLSVPTILFKVIIPFNLPRIINALPINLATALMTLTAAEMLGADNGMGYYVRYSLSFANYTKAIAGIIFIGLVVTLLNSLINLLKKHLIKWNY